MNSATGSCQADARGDLRLLLRTGLFVGFVLSSLATVATVGAFAGTIVLRSGAGLTTSGSADPAIHYLLGPTDGRFGSRFTAAKFAAARSGPNAVLATPDPAWLAALASDPLAKWVNTSGLAATGSTALYAIDFVLATEVSHAELTLRYAVDNRLGSENFPGVYVNETALDPTAGIGGYVSEQSFSANITPLVHAGTNTLYLYDYDFGAAAGIIFSVVVRTESASDVACPVANFAIDPRDTDLRTNLDPDAGAASSIALAGLGITAGDTIRLIRHGDFAYTHAGPENGRTILGVFSSDSVLLGPSLQYRIPGAIAAGTPYGTAPTTLGELPTDIPQDFAVTDTLDVVVPAGASRLFVCADDEYYGDNEDPNGDFELELRKPCPLSVGVFDLHVPNPAQIRMELEPNPTHGRTLLRWTAPASGSVSFDVLDVSGRTISRWTRQGLAGSDFAEELDLSGVARDGAVPGLLFLRMRQGSATATCKAVLLAR